MNVYEFTRDQKRDIIRCYKKGQSAQSIAGDWGMTPSVIYRLLKKGGVTIRPRGRVAQLQAKVKARR